MTHNDYIKIASNPVFFEPNRVFRVYRGGKLFKDFFGVESDDGCYPEEWIASGVRALNRDSRDEYEGISKIRGKDLYLHQLLKDYKELMLGERDSFFDILVKILDSAIRLPAQVHPDKAFSRKYFNSDYGKIEMWIVLATREDAKIYFGFRDGGGRNELLEAIEKSKYDRNIMASLMNEIPAEKGQVYLIPSNAIHAIGYGCLILEVQEPTDFTIQPEEWCGDYHLNEYEMYLGMKKEHALECFDFSVCGMEAIKLAQKKVHLMEETDTIRIESLISYKDTACFSVNRYKLVKGGTVLGNAPSVYIVTEGAGVVKNEMYLQPVKKGDYFFLPYSARNKCKIETESGVEFVECLPSTVI